MSDLHRFHQICWLASYPKSGNTWVRALLEAYYLGEVDINSIGTSVPDDLASRCDLNMPGGSPKTIQRMPIDVQLQLRPMGLLRMVLVKLAEDGPARDIPLFVKTHNGNYNANGVDLIPEALTRATIHLVRDPRDVVISLSKHMGLSIEGTIGKMADESFVLSGRNTEDKVDDVVGSWRAFNESYLDAKGKYKAVKTYRYEDLRQHTESVFADMLEHIGEAPVDRERVRNAVEASRLSRLRAQEKEKGFIEASKKNKDGFFGKGKVGGWREHLTRAQQRRIIAQSGKGLLQKLRYFR